MTPQLEDDRRRIDQLVSGDRMRGGRKLPCYTSHRSTQKCCHKCRYFVQYSGILMLVDRIAGTVVETEI